MTAPTITVPAATLDRWIGTLTRLADDVQIGLPPHAAAAALRTLTHEIRAHREDSRDD